MPETTPSVDSINEKAQKRMDMTGICYRYTLSQKGLLGRKTNPNKCTHLRYLQNKEHPVCSLPQGSQCEFESVETKHMNLLFGQGNWTKEQKKQTFNNEINIIQRCKN